jgi:hypothetical protein
MAVHFYQALSKKDKKFKLYRPMKNFKLENFSLAILEFCDSNIFICSDLEQK